MKMKIFEVKKVPHCKNRIEDLPDWGITRKIVVTNYPYITSLEEYIQVYQRK